MGFMAFSVCGRSAIPSVHPSAYAVLSASLWNDGPLLIPAACISPRLYQPQIPFNDPTFENSSRAGYTLTTPLLLNGNSFEWRGSATFDVEYDDGLGSRRNPLGVTLFENL